jgi:membrane protease YdiL (CAAX protease family)
VLAFNLRPPLVHHDLPGLLATAAAWAVLLAAALVVRRPLAVHAALLGGLGALLRAAMPRLWPALVPLLSAFGLYLLCIWQVPALRAGATWLRRGSVVAPVRWLVLAVIPIAVVGLVAWAALAGNAGLSEGTQQAIASVRGMSLWLLLPGALLFACANAAAEELFYRGMFMEALLGTVAVLPAVVLQAVSYGLQHTQGFPSGPLGIALSTAYGLLLGVIRRKANGLLAPWLAHVVADLTIIALIAWYAAATAAR